MPRARTASKLTRIAMAAMFGFVSLGHGPVMAFAKAERLDQSRHSHAHDAPTPAGHHGGHHGAHHPPSGEDKHSPPALDVAGALAPCFSSGCFAAVGPELNAAPTAGFILLGRLAPLRARTAQPASIEPADPPPRLPV